MPKHCLHMFRISVSVRLRIIRGFRASVNPRFQAGIPDFMDGITDFMEKFNTF